MSILETFDHCFWDEVRDEKNPLESLESGSVLYFPNLNFALEKGEERFLNPSFVDPKRKNISFDSKHKLLAGTLCEGEDRAVLQRCLERYCHLAERFVTTLIPHYKRTLVLGKTSLRPVEIAGRKTSPLKDDTRLHVDAFPSNPTKGQRILRFFTNINPDGKPRIWRVGEPFEEVVKRFVPLSSKPKPALAKLLNMLKITKDLRSPYDHYMLAMHNKMKLNSVYQKEAMQEEIHFPPNSSWMVFTDQVSHAAMSGQHVLEQTFHLPLAGLKNEGKAPIRVLERYLGSKQSAF